MTSSAARGQTLIELLVFVVAALIVAMAVMSVATETYRGQVIEMRAEGPRSGAQLAAHAISGALFSATTIVAPPAGSSGARLEGYIGRAALSATGPWISTQTGDGSGPYDRFVFCVDAAGRLLYYRDTNPFATIDPAAIDCGASAGGQVLTGTSVVAGHLSAQPFARPGGVVNVVQVGFDVQDAAKKADPEHVDELITLQQAAVSP